jgi:hypothetical protein
MESQINFNDLQKENERIRNEINKLINKLKIEDVISFNSLLAELVNNEIEQEQLCN